MTWSGLVPCAQLPDLLYVFCQEFDAVYVHFGYTLPKPYLNNGQYQRPGRDRDHCILPHKG